MGVPDPSKLSTLIGLLISTFELLGKAINFGNKVKRGLSSEGVYEVLDYEVTLKIRDASGKKAKVVKREIVRYLQDGIIAFQDQAWGDGKILLNYKTSPGHEVDRYRQGHKTLVLISLRKVRNKDDVDEHIIQWEMQNGFRKKQGIWSTDISHRTKHIRINVVFPRTRPPQRATMIEANQKRKTDLNLSELQQLPSGSWKLKWEKHSPRMFETYILDWEW